jgi:hypothetical protein
MTLDMWEAVAVMTLDMWEPLAVTAVVWIAVIAVAEYISRAK